MTDSKAVSIMDSIEPPMADWSANYLSTAYWVLSTGSEPCVSHSLFSSDSPQLALLPGKHNTAMRQAATGVRS